MQTIIVTDDLKAKLIKNHLDEHKDRYPDFVDMMIDMIKDLEVGSELIYKPTKGRRSSGLVSGNQLIVEWVIYWRLS